MKVVEAPGLVLSYLGMNTQKKPLNDLAYASLLSTP